jgi:hypothetical protein
MISLQKTVFCANRPYWGWTQSDGGSKEPSDHWVKRPFVPLWQTIPSCRNRAPKYDQRPIFENFLNFVLSWHVTHKNDPSDLESTQSDQ